MRQIAEKIVPVSDKSGTVAAAEHGAETFGILLLGGAHNALAAARSFGRAGTSVIHLTDDHQLPRFSHYVRRSFRWPGPLAVRAEQWLIDFATDHALRGWLLIPCTDPDVRFVAENLSSLVSHFQVNSPGWSVLQKVCDKQVLARTAALAGVASPKSFRIRSEDDAARVEVSFPVVLKPANRMERNAFSTAKAWQADTRAELEQLYRAGAALVGNDNVVAQELVPGGGETQFSYAALWRDNAPVAEIIARRSRQYPTDFGTSTFVEIVTNDAVGDACRKLLSSIGFEGLVEAEFKFDRRDNTYKVLDVNPRPWSWIGLCDASGVDVLRMMRDVVTGKEVKPVTPDTTRKWIHVVRDIFAGVGLISRGELTFGAYVSSFGRKPVFATFAWDDPLPGIVELPLTVYRVLHRRLAGASNESVSSRQLKVSDFARRDVPLAR